MKEKDIQNAILHYLQLRWHFHWRNNTGAFKAEHGSFVRFGTPGSPDIFVLKDGLLIGIEVKTPEGRVSKDQEAFGKRMELAGGKYLVARSVEDVMDAGL